MVTEVVDLATAVAVADLAMAVAVAGTMAAAEEEGKKKTIWMLFIVHIICTF